MTHSFQTSELLTPSFKQVNRKNSKRVNHLYQVEIEDFDNEIYSLEIEAKSYSDASENTSVLFNGDIYNMNIYLKI